MITTGVVMKTILLLPTMEEEREVEMVVGVERAAEMKAMTIKMMVMIGAEEKAMAEEEEDVEVVKAVEVRMEGFPEEGDLGTEECNDAHDEGLRPGQEISTRAHVCAKQSTIQIQIQTFPCTIAKVLTTPCQEDWEL